MQVKEGFASTQLDGKVVIFFANPSANTAPTPRAGVRVASLAGTDYFVWEEKYGEVSFDNWLRVDQVARFGVFKTMEDAMSPLEKQKIGGPAVPFVGR